MSNCRTFLAAFFLLGVIANAVEDPGLQQLRLSENHRFLVSESGAPVFLLCDTAWDLAKRVTREAVVEYLQCRRTQQFNAVTFVCFDPTVATNAYGAAPFRLVNSRMDPTQPVVTPGADPAKPGEYDYWDHLDFVIGQARRNGLYAIVLPCWGNAIVGGYSGEPGPEIVFNPGNARAYGRWLGDRYKDQPHILWMLGGDRSAAYADHPERDYRDVFRAMAAGLAEGGSRALVSFHPQKGGAKQARANPQSSAWFHADPWLSFNSIQLWPEHQIAAIEHDWQQIPAKPTWVFEPRYEAYWKKPYTEKDWGAWQLRQQAYQSVFAGGFGFTYGHERIFSFGEDGVDWRRRLRDPGAEQMRHLVAAMRLWSPAQALTRQPDQALVAGNVGQAERLKSDRFTATRSADGNIAMIYNANGRSMRVRLGLLTGPSLSTLWFDPRTGKTTAIGDFPNNGEQTFVPPSGPGDGNDWVLILSNATRNIP